MPCRKIRPLLPSITAIGLVLASSTWAQTSGTDTTATWTKAGTPSSTRLATTYEGFAGSGENSTSLVNGLRSGSPITLTDPKTSQTVTFTSPTRPMGDGNVKIALNLARTQLASQGITNPTPEQLQGALVGTTTTGPGGTTTTQGVLQMRASGMGWGQIANSMGVKLGAVMSDKQVVTPTTTGTSGTATGTATTGGTTVTALGQATGSAATPRGNGYGSGKSGVTTAAGTTAGSGGGNAYGNAGRSGITTAAGIGYGGGAGNAYGHGAGKGVVTAAGGGGGGNAGGGHGRGGGKP